MGSEKNDPITGFRKGGSNDCVQKQRAPMIRFRQGGSYYGVQKVGYDFWFQKKKKVSDDGVLKRGVI